MSAAIDLDRATVNERDDGHFVIDNGIIIAGPFKTNAAAWRWLDDHSPTGRADAARYERMRRHAEHFQQFVLDLYSQFRNRESRPPSGAGTAANSQIAPTKGNTK
jgi:hypothetical protein